MPKLRIATSVIREMRVSIDYQGLLSNRVLIFRGTDEPSPRLLVDLRLSQVSRGRRDNGEYFIQITAPDKVTVVKVAFKSKEEF